jgi:hypothetical protein
MKEKISRAREQVAIYQTIYDQEAEDIKRTVDYLDKLLKSGEIQTRQPNNK